MKIFQFPSEITEELAEETGWHIGDGTMNYYNNQGKLKGFYQLRGHIEDDKQHYFDRIKPIFKMLYGIDISLREMPSTRVFGFQIWSNELIKFKESLGLKVGPKLDLIIPTGFLKDDKLKSAIIRGIFDTDGCIYLENKNYKLYPRIQITTICMNLAAQLRDIFRELGINAIMSEDRWNKRGNRKTSYIVRVNGSEMFHKFMNTIKPANPKHIAKYNFYQKSFK